MQNYLITVYDDPLTSDDDWLDIEEFVKKFGKENLDKYFEIETDFIKTILEFVNFFSYEDSSSPLAVLIALKDFELNKNYPDYQFYGLDWRIEKLSKLREKNFLFMSEKEKDFILRCCVRFWCTLSFIHNNLSARLKIDTGASEVFYVFLKLCDSYNINDIFTPKEKVFFYHGYDVDDDDLTEFPESCGKKVEGLNL
ncbi:hypothetical protein VH441_05095 [Psychrobacter sp. HD31]|uniref:hypothetical protein n=1 Tax=Psychrobacter sp. HD31 TaxID=3112003 RepID=UPI003DA5AEA4